LLRLWMEMAVWLHPGDEQISENDKTFHWEKVTEFFFFLNRFPLCSVASLELVILLLQLSECWDNRCVSPYPESY
jgi:hypothetical protein